MGSYIKFRITDLGGVIPPYFEFTYSDNGFENPQTVRFNFVDTRDEAFEAVIGPDINQALKDAMDLDLVPSGEWETSIDAYYLTLTSLVDTRTFFPSFRTSFGMVYNGGVYNDTSGSGQEEIEIIQGFTAGALLNAYNDNVLRFNTSLSKLTATANGQLPITLYPSPAGGYYLNLKDWATTLINQNKFKDEILPDIQNNGYVYADPSLFLNLTVDYTGVNFSDQATYHFLKSVAQIKNFSEKVITKNYLLLPQHQWDYKVTYYEGYPFDISLFAATSRTITIKNKTNNMSVSLDVNQYANRLFLSQGSQNFTIDDVLPLQTGFNRLEVDFGTETIDLVVKKKESLCAPYLKFYRNDGGFGYIRFEKEIGVENRTKDGETIVTDFEGIQNTLVRSFTDKNTSQRFEFQTEALEIWEMKNFEDLLSSPRVEMYVGDIFQKQNANSWIGVKVSSNSIDTRKPKSSKLREKIKVELDLYGLHL